MRGDQRAVSRLVLGIFPRLAEVPPLGGGEDQVAGARREELVEERDRGVGEGAINGARQPFAVVMNGIGADLERIAAFAMVVDGPANGLERRLAVTRSDAHTAARFLAGDQRHGRLGREGGDGVAGEAQRA